MGYSIWQISELPNVVQRYSLDQRCQKWRTRTWQRFQRRNIVIDWNKEGRSGRASMGRPMRKWPEVSASIPSSASGTSVSGLEFKHASIYIRTVVSSSNVSLTSPTIFLKFFMLLTAASHKPPKCGACSGVNLHCTCMPHVVQKSPICSSEFLTNSTNSWISLAAPMKFMPWSLHMMDGFPRRAMKRQNVAINVVVVSSVTGSTCTAFTDRETNKATYALVMTDFLTRPGLIQIGPA